MDTKGDLIVAVDDILPQMQCGRCGYVTCRPYAEALVEGRADLDRCTPGGSALVQDLAKLLRRSVPGTEQPTPLLQVAVVVEPLCIGCTKCMQACPVDALVGAAQCMHTVIIEHCTGCALCVPACPVDCIDLVPAPFTWDRERSTAARKRFHARTARLDVASATSVSAQQSEADRLRAEIAAAVERTRTRRAAQRTGAVSSVDDAK